MSTVFISVSNTGCIELTINHLESLKRVGMTNYVAYAIDTECYDTLRSKGYNTHLLGRNDMNQYHHFNTPGFDHISFMRYHVIDKLLREGKTVWYLDVDSVVMQDLNSYVDVVKDKFDVALQDDCYMPCTGCMIFFPSALELVKPMIETRDFSKNDQVYFLKFLNRTKLRVGLLNRNIFPNGLLYFNDDNPKQLDKQIEFRNSDPSKIMFIHANWIVGVQAKITALKSKGLWFVPPRSVSENAESS